MFQKDEDAVPRVTTFIRRRFSPTASWSTPFRMRQPLQLLKQALLTASLRICSGTITDASDRHSLLIGRSPASVRCEAPGCIHKLSSTRLSSSGCFLCGGLRLLLLPFIA